MTYKDTTKNEKLYQQELIVFVNKALKANAISIKN
jgi:hypothetical protein